MTDVVYVYDEANHGYSLGKLTAVTDASGSRQFWYDMRGRTTMTQRTIQSVMYETQYTYDALDRPKTITYPETNREVITYLYDDAGNLAHITSSRQQNYADYAGYNPLGQPASITFGNSVSSTYEYEQNTYRLHRLYTDTLSVPSRQQDLTYDFSLSGDVESITDALNSLRTQTFIYDHLHRLTTATSGMYGTLSYAYDEIGNMKTNTRVAGEYKYMQDGNTRPHAIARIGTGPIWTYDANGNITNDGIRSITWDRDNKPKTIGSATFTYGYTGKRAMKASGGSTLRYVSDIYECKTSDTYCTMYIFGAGKRIASKTTQASPYLRYYHGDYLGSMSLTTISNGTKESAMYYYPYGETRTAESNPPSSARYRYTDQEEDAETGLYNYVARHYDPVIGRFMSPDSIVPDYADPQSLNRYSYVMNNPLIYTDPTGQSYEEMGDSDWDYYFPTDPWMSGFDQSVFVNTNYFSWEPNFTIGQMAGVEMNLSGYEGTNSLLAPGQMYAANNNWVTDASGGSGMMKRKPLTFVDLTQLVPENNLSRRSTTEVICVIEKESSGSTG
jgi:RHS repeat-associated protein